MKKIFLLISAAFVLCNISSVFALDVNEIDTLVEEIQVNVEDEKKKDSFKSFKEIIDSIEFDNTEFKDDPSTYSGKHVIESYAIVESDIESKFKELSDDKDKLQEFTLNILTLHAKNILEEYPEVTMIRTGLMTKENMAQPLSTATFYVVDGKLFVSHATTSYNPSIDIKQNVDQMLQDNENPNIPAELIAE